MKKQVICFLIVVLLMSMVSCGKTADQNDKYYDYTAEQIAEILDKHIKEQGKNYKPGTESYGLYLLRIERGDETALKERPEYNAIEKYAFIYTNDIVTPDDKVKLAKDKQVPAFMAGKTIRELAKEDHEKCRDYKSEEIAKLLHQRMKDVGEVEEETMSPIGEVKTIKKRVDYKPGTVDYNGYMDDLSSGSRKEMKKFPEYKAFQKYAFVYKCDTTTPYDPVKLSKDKQVPEFMAGKSVQELAAEIGDSY